MTRVEKIEAETSNLRTGRRDSVGGRTDANEDVLRRWRMRYKAAIANLETEREHVQRLSAELRLGRPEDPIAVPEGFAICKTCPRAALLDPRNTESEKMLNRRLSWRWPGLGWLTGTVESRIWESDSDLASGDEPTFTVKFDVDKGKTSQVALRASYYASLEDSPYDSWFLLDRQRTRAAEATGRPQRSGAMRTYANEGSTK